MPAIFCAFRRPALPAPISARITASIIGVTTCLPPVLATFLAAVLANSQTIRALIRQTIHPLIHPEAGPEAARSAVSSRSPVPLRVLAVMMVTFLARLPALTRDLVLARPRLRPLISALALPLSLALASTAAAQDGQISPPVQDDGAPSRDQGLPHDGSPELGTKGEAPLTAEEFDALTRGRTFDTYDSVSGLYGVESFLSGKRVIWRDAERCMHGSWDQVGTEICFWYEDHPQDPVCWNYYDRKGWILGHYRGMVDLPAIMLYPAQGPISCQAFLGV